MLNTIVIMFKRGAGVIWRVDIDAFDFSGKLLFQRFQRKEIVAMDQQIIEAVSLSAQR